MTRTVTTVAAGATGVADAAAASFLAQYAQSQEPCEPTRVLSDEQELVIATALAGHDVIVDASIGSGKTTTIQELCNRFPKSKRILYLTYSKLLKLDAKERIRNSNVTVHNYHGLAWYLMHKLGVRVGVSTVIERTVEEFDRLVDRGLVQGYDVIIIDEYQDVVGEYADLLRCLSSVSPQAQFVVVGDMSQKLRDNTNLDVERFFDELTTDAVHLPMLCSFRMGEQMGTSLGRAWRKQIVGANLEQVVKTVTLDEAMRIMVRTKPEDMLVLGKRGGVATQALNYLEEEHPHIFNKKTVYSSISTDDSLTRPGKKHAIFTTYDASKGLERKILFIFDYDDGYWLLRTGMPGVNEEIMRNVFLVAASRGKEEIYFVEPHESQMEILDDHGTVLNSELPFGDHDEAKRFIGGVHEEVFLRIEETRRPVYNHALNPSSMYNFVYAEHVRACYDLLDLERLDSGDNDEIVLPGSDGLIDLGFVLGWYQEALFFEGWDARRALYDIARAHGGPSASARFYQYYQMLQGRGERGAYTQSRDHKDLWDDCLVLAQAETGLQRYRKQVEVVPDTFACRRLVERIGEHLAHCTPTQGGVSGVGVFHDGIHVSEAMIFGRVDAVDPSTGAVWELKYTTELTREHFCQLGMYLVLSGAPYGHLFNTRTGELWRVGVPSPHRYLDASVRCATKGWYTAFEGETFYVDPEELGTSLNDMHDTGISHDLARMIARREYTS